MPPATCHLPLAPPPSGHRPPVQVIYQRRHVRRRDARDAGGVAERERAVAGKLLKSLARVPLGLRIVEVGGDAQVGQLAAALDVAALALGEGRIALRSLEGRL